MAFRKIAAATDFSQTADLAVAKAVELVRIHGAELVLVHVVPPLVSPTPLMDDFIVSQSTMGLSEKLKNESTAELKERYIEMVSGLSVERVILEGNPASRLAEFARKEGVDLLVMGSTGLSGLAGVLFGSTAAKTVTRAHCSVLVVRDENRES
ncbi:universal stress protein [Dethiosulfatarculus sandiegensis]|uniref:Universal stress protein n=1 Tax=Dethiosulfatarculus sandiegensis TaxID=1429043 RepID=A0A0D2J049_9BACT|nr:universal stress protein [Dethiosulfatarculus sandiegensis]KIX11599.1 hypothetical protein X474_24990 [Dethiosulfatarculus sandiegensis]